MKKIIVLYIFSFLNYSSFGQSFNFDINYNYKISYNEEYSSETILLINSSNADYHLVITKISKSEIKGTIHDSSNNKKHFYKIRLINNELFFDYLKTIDFESPKMVDFKINEKVNEKNNLELEITNYEKEQIMSNIKIFGKKQTYGNSVPFCEAFFTHSNCVYNFNEELLIEKAIITLYANSKKYINIIELISIGNETLTIPIPD